RRAPRAGGDDGTRRRQSPHPVGGRRGVRDGGGGAGGARRCRALPADRVAAAARVARAPRAVSDGAGRDDDAARSARHHRRPHAREASLRESQEQFREIAAERARLLENERHARAEAETANRLKDEFLAVLSHELRTPINAVYGWARLLRTAKSDEPTLTHGLE